MSTLEHGVLDYHKIHIICKGSKYVHVCNSGYDSEFRDRADLEPQEQQQFAEARDGGPGKTPGGYFQYVNVPAHKEYEFGWNRGNPKHYISRYEQNKDHRFRTRVR